MDDRLYETLERIEEKTDRQDDKLDSIITTVSAIREKVAGMDVRQSDHTTRIATLEGRSENQGHKIAWIRGGIAALVVAVGLALAAIKVWG